MAEAVEVPVKCSFCIRDLTNLTVITCAECPAVLCVKCFQLGSQSGKHKRGHNYEIHAEDNETLFNRQWGRDDEQNLIQTVHRYKLGNWDEVTAVISKGGLKRSTSDVARHFQLYFVQSTLGRTAMKEKEWIERRDLFKDDVSKVISDPSGRELYYHAVIEALRNVKELPDINDRDIVNLIDQVVKEYFASLNRTERKRKASELGAALSKTRPPIRTEAFPYGESDDDAWWERMCRVPKEKEHELERYYEEQSVCTEGKCMAEAVDPEDVADVMRMMKEEGLEEHEVVGKELKALRRSTFGEEQRKMEEKQAWGAAPRELFAFKNRLERPEPEAKRAKIVIPETSDRPHLDLDMKQEILMEAVVEDEDLVQQLEGQKFFEAKMQIRNVNSDAEAQELETSCDEAEDVDDAEEQEASGDSSATDSDSDVSNAVFDYEAYEAKMRAAGYQTDELYSDWDEEAKEEITTKLKELAQSGVLVDSSEEGDDEAADVDVEGLAESTADEDEADVPMDEAPSGSALSKKASLDLHCGLEEEAESIDDENEEEIQDDDEEASSESSELDYSDDEGSMDESSATASSSEIASDFESETEQLDALFGAPAMPIPKEMRKEKPKPKRTIKFYELGSDDEYHTMDEETAALPLVEMSVGESSRKAIARKLRAQKAKYYDVDPVSGRFVAKMPRPSMSPELEEQVRQYGQAEFARVTGEAAPAGSPCRSVSAADNEDVDMDRTPEARFGDDCDSQPPARARLASIDSNEDFSPDHPSFQKYLMEHLMDDSDAASACDSDDCESISSEVAQDALDFLGHPLTGDEEEEEVYEDAEGAPEGVDDGEGEGEHYEDAKDELMEHDGEENGERKEASEHRELIRVKTEAVEKDIKEEEPDAEQAKLPAPLEVLRVDTRAVKAEPIDDSEKVRDESENQEHPDEENDEVQPSPVDNTEEEDSEGALYQLAEEGEEANEDEEQGEDGEEEEDESVEYNDEDIHDASCACRDCKFERGEKLDEDECEDDKEEGEGGSRDKAASDSDECVRDIEGLEHHCVCYGCTKTRWAETLGEKEHALWDKIKQAGLSFEEVKEKLKRHFVDEDSESSESSDSDEYFDYEEEEAEEVYVDAEQVNDTDWLLKLGLENGTSPIPVSRNSHRSGEESEEEELDDFSDDESTSPQRQLDGGTAHHFNEDEKMEMGDDTNRPASSTKTTEQSSAMMDDSIYGLEEEQEDEEEEEEEEDKDKTPPMLQGDEKKEEEAESSVDQAIDDLPRSPILVIKKIQARGRTNLRVETRPRTPQEEKKVDERGGEAGRHPPPPSKKKKISKEFELLFKDLEIRKWEESQAKTLKERATKAIGTPREKNTRHGSKVAISDNSESEKDPRPKKINGGKKMTAEEKERRQREVEENLSKYDFGTPEPRTSRRASLTESMRKGSSSPTKSKKGTKRVAEPIESEKEQSSGDDEEEEEEETNGGEDRSPQKKRRKHKRVCMSKKERKARWDKKIQNRKAREEKKVEEKKAEVSDIEFFEKNEVVFFSNVFRRIAFDYEDHGFRNRVNFKSWVNEIFNMGYNQDRDDFEFEYYNDAEQIISRLNITNAEGGMPVDLETEIKLAKVDRYLRVLQERRALRNQAAEYETIPDFLQLCRRMNSERRKLKDIVKSKPEEEKFDNKLSAVLARDELLEMKQAKCRLLKIRSRTDKLKELHAAGISTLEGHESMARFKPRTKFGRNEDQKKVDERGRATLLEFDEKIASQLERLSLISGHASDEGRDSPSLDL